MKLSYIAFGVVFVVVLILSILTVLGQISGFAPASNDTLNHSTDETIMVVLMNAVGYLGLASVYVLYTYSVGKFRNDPSSLKKTLLLIYFAILAVAITIGSIHLLGFMKGSELLSLEERDRLTYSQYLEMQIIAAYIVGGALAPLFLWYGYVPFKALISGK